MSETVFNEGSIDVDFRVEGNTSTHAFFVEGETDKVGVGVSDPTALFEVKTDDENIARFDGLQGNIDFRYGSDIEFDRAGQVYITANNGSGELNFRTGGQNTRMHIDSDGDVKMSELLYVNNAVNHDRTTAGSTFRAANNGNAAITLLSSANHSAGVGTAIVALNFAANNEWSTTKDGVYAQIRCENGDGTYADRGQLVFATGYNGNTINDRMTIQSDGGVVMSAGKISMATQSGTGLAKIHGETTNKITLADDATTTLSSTPVMMILIYVHSGSYVGAGGIWGATYKGGTGLIYDDGNCANADTDGKLCCYKTTNSHTTTIKNRLGAEATFTIMSYSS